MDPMGFYILKHSPGTNPQKIGNLPESCVARRLHPCGTFGALVSDLQVGSPALGGAAIGDVKGYGCCLEDSLDLIMKW